MTLACRSLLELIGILEERYQEKSVEESNLSSKGRSVLITGKGDQLVRFTQVTYREASAAFGLTIEISVALLRWRLL